MAYIEENMKIRRGTKEDSSNDDGPIDPLAEIFRRKAIKEKEQEEGNVTNSMAMLTAIPEVDLGMESAFPFLDRFPWLNRPTLVLV